MVVINDFYLIVSIGETHPTNTFINNKLVYKKPTICRVGSTHHCTNDIAWLGWVEERNPTNTFNVGSRTSTPTYTLFL